MGADQYIYNVQKGTRLRARMYIQWYCSCLCARVYAPLAPRSIAFPPCISPSAAPRTRPAALWSVRMPQTHQSLSNFPAVTYCTCSMSLRAPSLLPALCNEYRPAYNRPGTAQTASDVHAIVHHERAATRLEPRPRASACTLYAFPSSVRACIRHRLFSFGVQHPSDWRPGLSCKGGPWE